MQLATGLTVLGSAALSIAIALPALEARTHHNTKWTSYSVGEAGATGACNFLIHKSAFGIALGPSKWDPSLCGRIISLKANGKQAYSQVLDKCESCAGADLNITERLFTYFSSDTSTPIVGEWDFSS